VSLRRNHGSHFVVCGSNPLAYRLVNELISRFDAEVTVILKSRDLERGPQIAKLPGVRLVEAPQLDDATLHTARVAEARALALVEQDDVGNIHTALRAHELNPDLRMVVRMFNMSLGHRIRTLFNDCAVLSDSAMAAPSLVAAALGEVAPSHIRLPGRTLYMARREEVPPARVVVGLADTSGPNTELLPADQDSADLVLAIADGTAREELPPQHPSRHTRRLIWVRALLVNRLVQVALAMVGVLVVGGALIQFLGHYGFGDAAYLTLLDASGAVQPDSALSTPIKVIQVIVTVTGISIIPVVTAAAVDWLVQARLSGGTDVPASISGHVVVVGLGNVGSRVIRQLNDLGVPTVCVDSQESARGVGFARRHSLPVVFGDASRDDVLRAASVGTARALVVLTNSDVVNLEAALLGRALREDLRVVLRLFDDDLAERVERNFGFAISSSVSRLAASSFAAAMMERQVIGTIPIGRSILMIADIPIAVGSQLAGQPISAAHDQGQARVIALERHTGQGAGRLDWSPGQTYLLRPQDRLIVLATRAGLGRVLTCSMSAVPQPDAG
jgi:Trk K+ transport system NAD-binding subunit